MSEAKRLAGEKAIEYVEDGTIDGRPVSAGDSLGNVVLRHRWSTPPD